MGVALKDKGDLKAAIDSYKQALKIKPDYAEAFCRIALVDKIVELGPVDVRAQTKSPTGGLD